MGNRKYNIYDKDKSEDAFAQKLRELAPDSDAERDLAQALGCTQNAIRQFKAGKSFPQPRNLVNIARYYKCSLDYLIGLSSVKSTDATVQTISEYTGLSEASIMALHEMTPSKEAEEKRPLSFINRCFNNNRGYILSLLDQYITSSKVRRRLDVKEVDPSQYKSAEELKRALEEEDEKKRRIWIDSSDDMSEGMFIAPLYREAKMTEIRKALESLREKEENK